ncbi:MAG TPA: acyl carrier protein [Polyangiaceae bacterium]
MRDLLEAAVREMIARHLDVAPASIASTQHVQRDLELDPLDLTLIALRFEEKTQVEFPLALLERVETVADLVALVKSVMKGRRAPRYGAPTTRSRPVAFAR